MFYSEELLMQTDARPKLYIVAAGMSYVPGHSDGQGGFVDGNGAQTPIRCLTLIRSDGAAKAIPFSFYNDNVNLAPTDVQISGATWVEGSYPLDYNSGYYNSYSSSVGPINTWIPAKAIDAGTGIGWDIPSIPSIRFVRNESLYMWGWPITGTQGYSCQISSDYSVTVDDKGVCKIYYQGNLIKTIRSQDA